MENSYKKIVEIILKIMNKPITLIKHVKDRPGQDLRYSLDSTKIRESIKWRPLHSFDDALNDTIKWYLDNQSWWEPLSNDSTLHPEQWTVKSN